MLRVNKLCLWHSRVALVFAECRGMYVSVYICVYILICLYYLYIFPHLDLSNVDMPCSNHVNEDVMSIGIPCFHFDSVKLNTDKYFAFDLLKVLLLNFASELDLLRCLTVIRLQSLFDIR